MALFQTDRFLHKIENKAFDKIHQPGEIAPFSGIYRCEGCGVELAVEDKQRLPSHRTCVNHHPEGRKGDVSWRLIVYANHKGE